MRARRSSASHPESACSGKRTEVLLSFRMDPTTQRWVAKFWARVDQTGGPSACWPWKLSLDSPNGYGQVRRAGRRGRAHRVAFMLSTGVDPEGYFVLHRCDNPPCCNPAHLMLGDSAENTRQRGERDRTSSGERNPRAKLTDVAVRDIRARCAAGESQRAIARDYGIAQTLVSSVHRRQVWKDA